jgi:transcriptional regulator with XRE-family HTH domain
MHTGDKIRAIRTLKGLSQENMATMTGLSRLAYGDIERGKTDISESRLKQIADLLKVSPTDILNFDKKMTNFFDHCNSPVGLNNGTQNNHYGEQELKHQLEVARLENEKLRLEAENFRLERDKAQLEAQLWQNKPTA